MKFFILPIVATVFTCISWISSFMAWQLEWKDNGDGTITSRKYGTYPKEVEFKQGMSLLPGQTTIMAIDISEELLNKIQSEELLNKIQQEPANDKRYSS